MDRSLLRLVGKVMLWTSLLFGLSYLIFGVVLFGTYLLTEPEQRPQHRGGAKPEKPTSLPTATSTPPPPTSGIKTNSESTQTNP